MVSEQQHVRPVAELITRFVRATNTCEIAEAADKLGQSGHESAVRPLLARLGDREVQSQPELADALCMALVALEVMCPCGECAFSLRPRHVLAPEVVDLITELGSAVPLRYFIARPVKLRVGSPSGG